MPPSRTSSLAIIVHKRSPFSEISKSQKSERDTWSGMSRPHSPVPQTMYLSQTERESWALVFMCNDPRPPFRPRKPSVRSPGRVWATCRARHRCQVSGRAWGERGRAGWGKHWPAPGRSRLLPTVRREEHVDHAPPMCGRMARATRPRMRGTGAGDGGSRGDGAGGKLGASGGRVTGRSPGCEQAA